MIAAMAIGERLVFELRGDWSRTRLDLRSYRTSTGAQVAGKEVLDVYGGELRLGWRL